MSEAKRIVIGSTFRQATHWVCEMIKANVELKDNSLVGHEDFARNFSHQMRIWEEAEDTCISVSCNMFMLQELHRRFPQAAYCYLWREPIDHFMSLSATSALNCTREFGRSFMYAGWVWGLREHELQLAEQLGIDLTHWHMDYYTTKKGFVELMKTLGLPLNQEIVMKNALNQHRRLSKPAFTDWAGDPENHRRMVTELFESMDRSTAAYKSARRATVDV